MKKCKMCEVRFANPKRVYCSNKCKFSDPIYNNSRCIKKYHNDKSKKIRHIKTGKTFNDIHNIAGALTCYCKKLGEEFNFDRFEIIDAPIIEMYKCKYCDWSTRDITNQGAKISIHHRDVHNINPVDHCKIYPEDSKLFKMALRRNAMKESLKTDYIICQICNRPYKSIIFSHLKMHGTTHKEYKLQFGNGITSPGTHKKLSKLYHDNFHKINAHTPSSKAEKEILEYVQNLGVNAIGSVRDAIPGNELDIYIPEKKIAIEYNGLYWHSEIGGSSDRNRHVKKLDSCERNGIHLITIFADDWKYKTNIVKNRLKSILGISDRKIPARKCIIKNIDNKTKSKFLIDYHIQGDDNSKYRYGAYYNDELVAVMTFGNLRKATGHTKKEGHYELLRYCSNGNIQGGVSKILQVFIKAVNPISIISYADRRWTTTIYPSVYEKCGFKLKDTIKPNYWYTSDYDIRLHRYMFTKHTIIEKYNGNPELTEIENMMNMGYDRIWDCGSLKYELLSNSKA